MSCPKRGGDRLEYNTPYELASIVAGKPTSTQLQVAPGTYQNPEFNEFQSAIGIHTISACYSCDGHQFEC